MANVVKRNDQCSTIEKKKHGRTIQKGNQLKNIYVWSQQPHVADVLEPKFCSKTDVFKFGDVRKLRIDCASL